MKLKDPGPQRYRSDVNPEWLLVCAERELREAHRQQYLALFLCLWAGLRRKEADLLMWQQVDLAQGQIFVRRTAYFEPKTEESQRDIDLSPEAVEVLRTFKDGSKSEFVLEGAEARTGLTYDYYRCDCTWRELHDWLRTKGVKQKKAIHSLRKESGSLTGMFDLTSAHVRRVLGVTLQELAAEDWRKLLQAGKESSSQALGRAGALAGASGLLVRSAAAVRGINVVVFPRAHRYDRMEVVEGEKLARLGVRLRA